MEPVTVVDFSHQNEKIYENIDKNEEFTEIAKILNISESNVGVKLHRIMKRLKIEMEREAK